MQFIYTYINTITYINIIILNLYSTFKNILLENFRKKQILSRALCMELSIQKEMHTSNL